MKSVGPLFKDILRIKKIEQKELAAELNITPQAVSALLKEGPDKWKLDYFEKTCKFLHVHPKSFFDDWSESGNTVYGNIENRTFFGDSTFSMSAYSEDSDLKNLLRQSIKDKETIISLQAQIQALKDELNEANLRLLSKDSQ